MKSNIDECTIVLLIVRYLQKNYILSMLTIIIIRNLFFTKCRCQIFPSFSVYSVGIAYGEEFTENPDILHYRQAFLEFENKYSKVYYLIKIGYYLMHSWQNISFICRSRFTEYNSCHYILELWN